MKKSKQTQVTTGIGRKCRMGKTQYDYTKEKMKAWYKNIDQSQPDLTIKIRDQIIFFANKYYENISQIDKSAKFVSELP